jgi:hypothetical protein
MLVLSETSSIPRSPSCEVYYWDVLEEHDSLESSVDNTDPTEGSGFPYDSRLSAQISKSLARVRGKARFLTCPTERVAETPGGTRRQAAIDDGGNPPQPNKQSDHQSSAEGGFWMPQGSYH